MNIAIVTDDLIQKGGQEKVISLVTEMWPNAPIYTTVASEYWLRHLKSNGVEVKTSFMQKLPYASKLIRYYFPLFLHPLAFESFDFSNFDVVLSISARYSHFVITKPTTLHICYMNSPGRMFWEPKAYFEKEDYGFLKPLKKLANGFLSLPLSCMRILDYVASNRVDFFIANSKTPADRIKKYYGRNSDVIYPYVDTDFFTPVPNPSKNYFLIVTRLVAWKRVDIAIEACNKLGLNLIIVGEGPDKPRLQALAGPTIEFKGYAPDEEKCFLLQNSIALINTQFEDFGIVPLEAMASGRPVIAFGKGGVLETVLPTQTGEFFNEQTWESLVEVLKNFNEKTYDPIICREHSLKFSKKVFVEKLNSFVNSKYSILG